jgi:hypothetical protein
VTAFAVRRKKGVHCFEQCALFFWRCASTALGRSRVERRDWRLFTPSGITKRVGQF